MNNVTNFSVGNVKFTDEGVQVCIPYSQSSEAPTDRPSYDTMVRPRMVAYCNRRMRRCASKLGQNLASANVVTPEGVAWKGGHFSLPVYKALKEFVDHRGDKKYLSPLILQQVIREMANDRYIYESHLDADVYKFWKESKQIDEELFFNIVTEMLLVASDWENFRLSLEAI